MDRIVYAVQQKANLGMEWLGNQQKLSTKKILIETANDQKFHFCHWKMLQISLNSYKKKGVYVLN